MKRFKYLKELGFFMIEEEIQKKMRSALTTEKTFIDKIFGREDVKEIRNIVKKPILGSEDISELLYLVNSVEQKLYNYDNNDRKIIGKFFVWLREIAVIYKHLFEYEEDVKDKQKRIDAEVTQTPESVIADLAGFSKKFSEKHEIHDELTRKIISDMKRKFTHCITFMADVLFFMSRSSLSVGATGFKEALRNKFEIKYDTETQTGRKGLFSM